MDAVIGVRTHNFTLIASDTTINRSSLLIKSDEPKIATLDASIFAYTGDQADAFRQISLIKEDGILNSLRYNTPITPRSISNFIQNEIYQHCRSSPTNTEWLVGGGTSEFDLYSVDMYGAKLKGNYFCLGSARYFGYGRFDELYHENLSYEEAVDIVKDIGNVLKKRFVKRFDKFDVRMACSEGIKESVVLIE